MSCATKIFVLPLEYKNVIIGIFVHPNLPKFALQGLKYNGKCNALEQFPSKSKVFKQNPQKHTVVTTI